MQRRRWLQLSLGAAALLAVGSTTVAWVSPGLVDARLAPAGRAVMRAAAQAILDDCLPKGAVRAAALDALLLRIDGMIAALPAHVQTELGQLLTILASVPGRRALAGLAAPWTQADIPVMQAALQGMRTSGSSLRRQAYQALHELSCAAWFSDSSTWAQLGYPGPREI